MLDASITNPLADRLIDALNAPRGSSEYVLTNKVTGEVRTLRGVWQGQDPAPNPQGNTNVKRPGNQDYVFKTRPDAVDQPALGDRLEADGETWEISSGGRRQGMLLSYPLSRVN